MKRFRDFLLSNVRGDHINKKCLKQTEVYNLLIKQPKNILGPILIFPKQDKSFGLVVSWMLDLNGQTKGRMKKDIKKH